MSSRSLAFDMSQNSNMMLFTDSCYTPGLSADTSVSSGTTSVSPSTPLDSSLLSPANLTYGHNGTLGALGGPTTHNPSAYSQLLRRYQQIEYELTREKEEHGALKIYFEKLLETNKILTATQMDNAKRPRADDLELSATVPPGLGPTGSSALGLSPLSRSEFPHIKFWTKEEWDEQKSLLKDASGPKGKGPERSSKGLNTTALYLENEDGTPVSGATVGQIRAAARAVWIELFDRGKAPSTWGKASLEARNMYHSELERRWGILRCCENHWKADALATAHYSQWYLGHKARMAISKDAGQGEVSEARAPKRAKTAIEGEDEPRNVRTDFTADLDDFGSMRSETPMDDLRVGDNQPSEAEDEVPRELGNVLPRPEARPLRDPLADVFNQAHTTPFQVLARVPDRIPCILPINSSERDAETTGEGSTRTAQDSTEAGAPPVSVTVPPPQASDSGQQLGPSDGNLTELEIALANPNLGPENRKFAESAKFKNAKKMVPGNATTARRFCAEDWCAKYPNGTEGQFKYYWETLDDKSSEKYKAIEKAQKNAKAATARAAKSAAKSGESASN